MKKKAVTRSKDNFIMLVETKKIDGPAFRHECPREIELVRTSSQIFIYS